MVVKDYAKKILFFIKSNIRSIQYECAYRVIYWNEQTKLDRYGGIYSWSGEHFKLPRRPRILFVWPTIDQAENGLIQALVQWGDVTIYENLQGDSQYNLTGRDDSLGSAAELRRLNSIGLEKYFPESNNNPYDIIFTQAWGFSFSFATLRLIREKGCKIINVCMDDRHLIHRYFAPLKLGSRSLSRYCDLVLTNVPESIDLHLKAGAGMAMFWPEAAGQEYFYSNLAYEDRNIDVLFVGQNYGARSQRVLALQRAGIQVESFGKGWPNGYAPDIPSLYKRAKIVLGSSEIGYCKNLHHIKMRDFEAPMSGSCYVTRSHSDLPLIYNVGKEIIVYDSTDDLVEKVKELLSNPEYIASVAELGFRKAANEHTWKNRIEALMSTLGESNGN
jgi:spore maturation protein CgeB